MIDAAINRLANQIHWVTLREMLLREVANSHFQVLPASAISENTLHPGARTPSQAARSAESSTWEPSQTAKLLGHIMAEHHNEAPTARLRLVGMDLSPEKIAHELKSSLESQGLSHHAMLAKGVQESSNALQYITPQSVSQWQNNQQADIMYMMTGHIKNIVETPLGPAIIVWQRNEEPTPAGEPSKFSVCSASLLIEHRLFGTIMAHLYLNPQALDITIGCNWFAVQEIQNQLPALRGAIRALRPHLQIRTEVNRVPQQHS